MSGIDKTLFPVPVVQDAALNALVPQVWPGITPTSTELLRKLLTENHNKYHIYFNERRFHNHVAHTALTLWALGANEDALNDAYDRAAKIQKPFFTSPGTITKDNWTTHLGDGDYYQGYLSFFKSELEAKKFDYGAVLEEYVMAPLANYDPESKIGEKVPLMLNRFLSGVVHSFIHAGFGIEFNLPGLFAEGLALGAVEKQDAEQLFSPEQFAEAKQGASETHAFTILARILAEPKMALTEPHAMFSFYSEALEKHGEAIRKYADEWIVNDSDVDKKVEELIWTATLLYGVGGTHKHEFFNADFFFMHFVTSSIFIPTVVKTLKNKTSQLRLLKGYFAIILSWYIAHGRPALNLRKFFSNPNSLVASPPGPARLYHGVPLANQWHEIMQATLRHPDDHLSKLQRALASHAVHFGKTSKGTFVNVPELDGVEEIDGTLFLRTALLTMDRLGWVFDTEKTKNGFPVWDREGFWGLGESS
ncbi:hypothetical protein CPC08DRAFT_768992 [Agrocybe pediades]|nr:hypothetical protein CPC08DRAFT_768992 [Agrocybe pediades]